MDVPIVCALTTAQLQERRRTVLAAVRRSAVEIISTSNGLNYRFKATPGILALLCNLVELESRCCQFLTFKLVIAPRRLITLQVSGPPEAKTVIDKFFGK